MNDKIGQCVYVIYHKLWGKTLFDKKLKSKGWWERRLQELINSPEIKLPYQEDWIMPDIPVRYEDEMKLK